MAGGANDGEEEMISGINVTPLVDITLVLLIIFMVTATYIVAPSIKVNLPDAVTAENVEPTSLGISVLTDGSLLLDGQPVTELLHNVWPLVVMGVVLIPLGVYVFGVAERYAKRTGKLKRVG